MSRLRLPVAGTNRSLVAATTTTIDGSRAHKYRYKHKYEPITSTTMTKRPKFTKV
jgi:hypothetical protein